MIKKTYILGVLQIFIIFIIGVFVESVSSGELLFTKDILDNDFRAKIISHPVLVLSLLGLGNLILYIYSHKTRENKEQESLYDNICQIIFDQYIKPSTTLDNSKFRVSLFSAKKGFIFRRANCFFPEFRIYLQNVGRYQTRQERKKSNLKFLPGEGAVGNSYLIGEFLFEKTIKYNETNKEKYFIEQQSKFNLSEYKVKSLNDKSCSFVCCPIKFFKSDEIFGVVVVDCVESNQLRENDFRTIESIISNYSVFFNQTKN